MKKIAILATVGGALVLSAFTSNLNQVKVEAEAIEMAPVKAVSYKVILDKSEIKWNAKKVTGEHYGKVVLQNGQLMVDKNRVTGGTFVIDMNSLTVDDIKDEKMNGRLKDHLKSDDFFSTDKFPTATFTITSVKPIAKAEAGKPNSTVTGDLTVKGISNSITFPATISVKNGIATAVADVTIDRTKYDIRYRSSNFFENLGDKAIYDDFTISLNISAKQ